MQGLERVIPHIPSKNMDETIEFMSSVFGFKASSQLEFYAELLLESMALGILKSEGEPNQQSIYLQVSDVDSVWKNAEKKLRNVNAKPPFNQEYGMREIHITIPATNTLLFVGSALNRQQ